VKNNNQLGSIGRAVDTSTTAGDDEQQKRVADDEGSNKEGGKGDGNGDEGGERATATMVKKRARAARAMVTRVVGDKEGDGDGGNMARNNEDGLVPVVVQQPVLYSSSAMMRATKSRPDDVCRTRSAQTTSATTKRQR
jgi:hypothetical protein